MTDHLDLIRARDGAGSHRMLCGGDDAGGAVVADSGESFPPLVSFAVVRSWDWPSMVDGRGRGHRVRLKFAGQAPAEVETAVEVIGEQPRITTEIPL